MAEQTRMASFRCPENLYQDFKELADSKGLSFTDAMLDYMKDCLEVEDIKVNTDRDAISELRAEIASIWNHIGVKKIA